MSVTLGRGFIRAVNVNVNDKGSAAKAARYGSRGNTNTFCGLKKKLFRCRLC